MTSIAFTEHHFHVEGFELSNDPPLAHPIALQYVSLISNDAVKRSFQLFANEVLPRFA